MWEWEHLYLLTFFLVLASSCCCCCSSSSSSSNSFLFFRRKAGISGRGLGSPLGVSSGGRRPGVGPEESSGRSRGASSRSLFLFRPREDEEEEEEMAAAAEPGAAPPKAPAGVTPVAPRATPTPDPAEEADGVCSPSSRASRPSLCSLNNEPGRLDAYLNPGPRFCLTTKRYETGGEGGDNFIPYAYKTWAFRVNTSTDTCIIYSIHMLTCIFEKQTHAQASKYNSTSHHMFLNMSAVIVIITQYCNVCIFFFYALQNL